MENTMTSSSITQSFKIIKIIENFLFHAVKWKNPPKQLFFQMLALFEKSVISILVSIRQMFHNISCSSLKTLVSIRKLVLVR